MQRHLGGHLGQTLHQEVRRPHSHLQRAEGMFDCLATLAHSLRVFVEALLDGFQYMLMLPPGNASLRAGGAAFFEGTVATRIRPIAPQLLSVLFIGIVIASDVGDLRTMVSEVAKKLDSLLTPTIGDGPNRL